MNIHNSLACIFSLVSPRYFLFVVVPTNLWHLPLPAEPEEKQKEILNNTIPEGRDSGDLPVSTHLSMMGSSQSISCVSVAVLLMCILQFTCGVIICIHRLSLVSSEICRRLPRPVVRGDGASWHRGVSQCGGVSVRLQGRPGLRRPGDSGLRHEGKTSESRGPPGWDDAQRLPNVVLCHW